MGQFKKTSTSSSSDFVIDCDKDDSINSLQGQLLIASPHMDDIRFKKSVIMICQHNAQSAMGLVINKQANSLKLGELYEKLEIGAPRFAAEDPVHIGGPVDSNRGFVLHSQDHMLPESLAITNEISLTASVEILRDITGGVGPSHTIVSLGCAGWSAGQLDHEMSENVWINLPASTNLVFEHDRKTLWQQAFDTIGINPAYFAGGIGSA